MALDLGKILLEHQTITTEQLNSALSLEMKSGSSLGSCLVKIGSVTESQIANAIAVEFALPLIKLKNYPFDRKTSALVPEGVAKRYCVAPMSRKGHTLTLATADPSNIQAVDEIKIMTGLDIELVVSTQSDINAAIAKLYVGDKSESVAGIVPETNIETELYSLGIETAVMQPAASASAPSGTREVEAPNYTVVKIFYTTDRRETGEKVPSKFYGGQRNKEDCLTFGTCDVSIPRDHKLAHIERPSWRNLYREDPKKHVVLMSVNLLKRNNYFSEISADIACSRKKQVLVFIHGFDVTFEEGAWRMAQLAYDLGFDGPPVLYSWASVGHLRDYSDDEATMEWSVPHLKGLLADIGAKCGAQMVHVIAHSMGNRILTNALKEIALTTPASALPLVEEVILTAPDIDAGVFRQIAGEVQKAGKRITLYASSNDKALEASKRIHGGPRAGDSGDGIVVVPGVDTIDASAVDTSFIGHSYYGDNRSVLSDIFHLLMDGAPPSERFGLRKMSLLNAIYWAFLPS